MLHLCPYLSPPFFFYCSGHHRDLHSFPTRRSSDLSRGPHDRDGERARLGPGRSRCGPLVHPLTRRQAHAVDRKSTRLNSSHRCISYAVFCLKKKKKNNDIVTGRGLSQEYAET